jgi:hypothetical protein
MKIEKKEETLFCMAVMHALYTAWPHIYCSQVGIVSFSGKVAIPLNPPRREP